MKPQVLVARKVFPEVIDRLREHFEVEDNPDDRLFDKAELI
jgi:gluconate 2-dehydrogenase